MSSNSAVSVDPTEDLMTFLQWPIGLAQLLSTSDFRPSDVKVLFTWILSASSPSRGEGPLSGPFRTTDIAERCGITIESARQAKARLVARGVFVERAFPGRASILTLHVFMTPPQTIGGPVHENTETSKIPTKWDTVSNGRGVHERSDDSPNPSASSPSRETPPQIRGGMEPPPPGVDEDNSSAAQGHMKEKPLPSEGGSTHARVASTRALRFKTQKLVLSPPTEEPDQSHVEEVNSDTSVPFPRDLGHARDTLSQRSKRLYHLFLDCPENHSQISPRLTNSGEYLQIRRFLKEGVPDALIADAIKSCRGRARHFGLVRWLVLKTVKEHGDPGTHEHDVASRPRAVGESRHAAEVRVSSAGESAYSRYEGMPNAVAYRDVDPSLVQKWRELYPEEY